jgi:hypothetical protein
MVKHYIRSNGQTLYQVKQSNITNCQTLHQVKRSDITSAQTLGWSTLVLTKRLAVHIDWRTPLVSLVVSIGECHGQAWQTMLRNNITNQ